MYAVFAGSAYYPCGGWNDFVSTEATLADALKAAANTIFCDWWHIVDLTTFEVVESGGR